MRPCKGGELLAFRRRDSRVRVTLLPVRTRRGVAQLHLILAVLLDDRARAPPWRQRNIDEVDGSLVHAGRDLCIEPDALGLQLDLLGAVDVAE